MSEVLRTDEEKSIALEIAWKSARAAVIPYEDFTLDLTKIPEVFTRELGAFVTAYEMDEDKEVLRGCIGVPQPIMPLGKAIEKAARDTVLADPRFPEVTEAELEYLVLEVEVLSPFQELRFGTLNELYNQINIGVDGLVIYSKHGSGLLLPPVPVKYNWDTKEFVASLCRKAWVSEEVLFQPETKVMKFQAQIIR